MSAPNFFKRNARNYYALHTVEYYDFENDSYSYDYENEHQDVCEIDIEENLTYLGEQKGYDVITVPMAGNRPVSSFALEKDYYFKAGGLGYTLSGRIFIRPGYYDGAVLDWGLSINEIGENDDLDAWSLENYINELLDNAYYYSAWPEGIKRMNRAKEAARLLKEFEAFCQELDDFCRDSCDMVLGLAFRASNGEAGYFEIPKTA